MSSQGRPGPGRRVGLPSWRGTRGAVPRGGRGTCAGPGLGGLPAGCASLSTGGGSRGRHPQHCTVNVYQPYSDQFKAEEAYVYNTIYAKALSGNPPSHFVGNAQALPPACEGPPSGTGSSPTGSSSPSSAGSATPPTQSCPTSAELLTVWDAAFPALRQSWAAPSMTITGFAAISCWSSWVVATPMSSSPGNGTFVFSQQGTLHLIPVAQMQAFRNAVCASPDSPIAWRNETLGGCSS